MNKPISLKTKSFYIGCYDFEDESSSRWLTFVYSSSASDAELEKHFRNVVHKADCGEKLKKSAHVDVYELREAHDYTRSKSYKIALTA